MALAVQRVKDRLRRATSAVEREGIPYVVVGDCAAAAWIESFDPSGVRTAKVVEILVRSEDAKRATAAIDDADVRVVSGASDEVDGIRLGHARVAALEPLVRMMLTRFRLIDRVHLGDMLEVGLIDSTWVERVGGELGKRLQHLIDTPEG